MKCQKFTPSGCKDLGIRKFKDGPKTKNKNENTAPLFKELCMPDTQGHPWETNINFLNNDS